MNVFWEVFGGFDGGVCKLFFVRFRRSQSKMHFKSSFWTVQTKKTCLDALKDFFSASSKNKVPVFEEQRFFERQILHQNYVGPIKDLEWGQYIGPT